MKKQKGFTLIEVVVVVAVVALLAAIIVPMVAKQVDDAKIARAKNECMVIAAALGQFYKDIGVWPAAAGGTAITNNTLYSLISGTAVSGSVADTAVVYGFNAVGNDDWYDGGQTAAAGLIDIFDNHLNVDTPEGAAGTYTSTGEFRWKGPYLPPIGMDPWGHPYMCNIRAAYNGTDTQCVVMSAGPDGTIDTTYTAARNGLASSGSAADDDIIVTVHMRQ